MATGIPPSDAPGAFLAIARDEASMRSFLGSIGDAHAASRVRICELLEPCDHVLDVGCGPALTYSALAWHRSPPKYSAADDVVARVQPRNWLYCGIDPVRAMLEASEGGLGRMPILELNERLDDEQLRRAHGLVVVPWPFEVNRCVLRHGEYSRPPNSPPCADGVVLRHVLEHLQDPAPLLQSCARSVRPGGRLVVVFSQETHGAGFPLSLLTDRHLGACRWSHYRPAIYAALAGAGVPGGWRKVSHLTHADGLVVREELLCWERER